MAYEPKHGSKPEVQDPPAPVPDPQNDPALQKIRRRRWPMMIAVLIAIIIISGGITYYVLYTQATEREAKRAEGYELLDQAIAMIQESDTEVIAIDTATKSEVSKEDLPQRQVLIDKIPATSETLSTAYDKANQALDLLSSSEDKALAGHVIDAAQNRQSLLSAGQILVEADIKAMNCALIFGQAWDKIIQADLDMRSAADISNTGTYSDAQDAATANSAVLELLNQASTLVSQAHEAFTEVDFSTINNYLALRKESVQLALDSDLALAQGDLETATIKNLEFGEKDSAVVAAATKIPPEPLTIITAAYDAFTADSRQIYDSARANAADADVFIREYVGVDTQTAVQ